MGAYSKLGDELDRIIDGYDTEPNLTEFQRSTWNRNGRKKAITHDMFGCDHEKALRLSIEDGYDGGPVCSRKVSSARRFWDYGEGHVFPSMEDLVRFGLFMRLDLYRILALTLKNEWERFYCQTFKDWRVNCGQAMIDLLMRAGPQEIQEAVNRFNPDSNAVCGCFEKEGIDIASEGYTPDSLDTLVQEMILAGLHLARGDSRETADFIERKRKERRLLREGAPEQQQAFLPAKCAWVNLHDELADLYLRIESLRLENAEITRQWLVAFGVEEISLREQLARCADLLDRLTLKRADPKLSREEISEKVAETLKIRNRELQDLRADIALAPRLRKDLQAGAAVSDDEFRQYRDQCRKVLRRIRFMVHPDRLMNHPAYARLTDTQKEGLRRILNECLDVRPEELGYPKGCALRGMRSLEGLQAALGRVEAILDNAGIDTDVDLVIQGDTLVDQLTWLEREIHRLERETSLAKAELRALAEDDDVARMRSVLEAPEKHDSIRADLREKIEAYRQKGDRLETELDMLFDGR